VAIQTELDAMRRAIAVGRDAVGVSNPNPPVGAVVLDATGTVVGTGATRMVGAAHAEVVALAAAGSAARGGTLVTSLEPCRHTGRTGPCTDVIAAAGVQRVVYALQDPGVTAGGGGDVLRGLGIDVEAGVLAAEAAVVLGPWVTAEMRGRPHLTWKYAASLDGRTAAADGSSRWITGDEARRDVHAQRLAADAVLVGSGTVVADDPALTVRAVAAARQPIRVVLDTSARTPIDAAVLDDAAPTIVIVGTDADADRVKALRGTRAEVVECPVVDGHLDPARALDELFARDQRRLLLEGGRTVASAFLRQRLVDRVVAYLAPKLVGAGVPVLDDIGAAGIDDALRLTTIEVTPVGEDIRIVAEPTESGG
jgi:diaminohydroxyphosphoribosylaminopyrimidine deaminase/5-amino-6-(5-phosphoribosylamino)uracil reductase